MTERTTVGSAGRFVFRPLVWSDTFGCGD